MPLSRRLRARGGNGLRGERPAREWLARRFASRATRASTSDSSSRRCPELGWSRRTGRTTPSRARRRGRVVARMDGRRRRVRRHRPLRRRARHRPRRGCAGDGARRPRAGAHAGRRERAARRARAPLARPDAGEAAVIRLMNPVELMLALKKIRARRTPANQAHVTNLKENPVQLAADAAEALARGFAELETTFGVVRYAPLIAIAIQVGGQTGRPAVLTQCAVEEGVTSSSACAVSSPTPRRSRSTAPSRSSSTATTRRGRRRSWPRPTPRAASRCASPRAPARRC